MTKLGYLTAVAMFCAAGNIYAAPADDAIQACRAAIEQAQGDDVVAKLSKVRPRGNNYEVWFNVQTDQVQQRSYCYLRRGEVQQMVTEDGQWKGRNPKRPQGVDLS